MGIENIETAHQEYGKKNDIAPVHDAHRQRMPVIRISTDPARLRFCQNFSQPAAYCFDYSAHPECGKKTALRQRIMRTDKECLQYEYPLETVRLKFFHNFLSLPSIGFFICLAIFILWRGQTPYPPPPCGLLIGIYLFYENWSTETFRNFQREQSLNEPAYKALCSVCHRQEHQEMR